MTTQDITYTALLQRLDAIDARVRELVDHQRKTDELFADMTPIAREVLATATSRLDELDKKGYFAFAREASYVAQRVIEGYTAEDVRAFGDAIVGILDTVRTITQPEMLKLVGETGQLLAQADGAQPLGLYGMVRATREQDVQRGMAVMMELLRKVGQGANVVAAKRTTMRKKTPPRRALGVERPATPKTCAVPKPAPQATVIDGIAYTAEGHLVDATQWSPQLALAIATLSGVTLTDRHWEVLQAARKDFAEMAVSPNIRRLTQTANVTTKELYALFPKAPGRTIAKIAGLPKPAGCL